MAMQMPSSRTIPDLLDEMAERYPDREAIVYGKERLTYREVRVRARHLAKGLYGLGVRRGDKVALLMGNQTEWLLVDFAVTLLGATLVAINTWYKTHELKYVLGHSDATTLILAERYLRQDYMGMLSAIGLPGTALSQLQRIVCLSATRFPGITPFDDLWELAARVSDAEIDAVQRAVAKEDTAYILYTSGTTAMPKGVQLQHYALIENMYSIGERQHLTEADRLWMGVSLFWGFGCENALMAIMTHGGCVVLQHAFDPADAFRLIERERCTVYYGTPNIAIALYEHPDRSRYDLRSLRTGAAFGAPQVMRMVMDLGAEEICNIYGLTESYGNCAVTDAHDPVQVRLETVGRPLPGNDVVIANPETHEPLPVGEVGEIKIRGYVMPGYYKDPARNAQVFDSEGFFLSGDLGFYDEQGYLHFRARMKEMLKTGGINVAPAEVEEFLITHPHVTEAYVVGIPDARKEEVIAAAVVVREPGQTTADELQAMCRASLASYKVPRYFKFFRRQELPLTATGKVQKEKLREMLLADLERSRASAGSGGSRRGQAGP
jgi:fatty-acyl-CoA synthase